MATIPYPYEIRDSSNSSTDNRVTGLTPTVSNGKLMDGSGTTVQASNVTVIEILAGVYSVIYDATAHGDAVFPVDWGSSLSSPSDRYGSLVLTQDPQRVITNLDAAVSSRSTFAGGAVAAVTGNVGGNVVGTVASVTGNVGGSVASVAGNVTVGGYVTGQDPATLILDAAQSGHNTTGSIGAKIGTAASNTAPTATVVATAVVAQLGGPLGVEAVVGAGSTASSLILTAASGFTLSSSSTAYQGASVRVIASTSAGTVGTAGVTAASSAWNTGTGTLTLSTALPTSPTTGDTVYIL